MTPGRRNLDDRWLTLDGRLMRVPQMDDAHLCNALRMQLRRGWTIDTSQALLAMVHEAARRKLEI